MSYFTNLIFEHGLIAMFFIILLEYACFPVSSEIVLPFSGAIASLQDIPFLIILPVSVLAGLIGTSICYFVGRFGGGAILDRIENRFPKTKKGIDSSYTKFHKYGTIAVCVGRVIPLCRTYIAFVAGAAEQNYGIFLSSSFIGITVWNSILLGLGYLMRENWKHVGAYYKDYKEILLSFIILIITLIIMHNKSKSSEKK